MKIPYLTSTAMAVILGTVGGAAAAQDMQNMIDTSDVMVDGANVTFSSVMAEQDGYLVIHTTQGGEVVVPQSIGSAAISAGENTDVTVTTEYPLVGGENYVAMLHVESNNNETYDFGPDSTDVDTPVMENDEIVTASFSGAGAMSEDTTAAQEQQAQGDLFAVAEQAGQFSTLLEALRTSDADWFLEEDMPYTLLAPTDEAFSQLPEGAVEALLQEENRDALNAILEGHVIPDQQVASGELSGGQMLEPATGEPLEVTIEGEQVMVGDATVVQPDIQTEQGVVHAIDMVLVPELVADALRTRGVLPASEGGN